MDKKYATGLRNNYRFGMPLPERIWKDVRCMLSDFAKRIRSGGRLPVIVCWPDLPSKRTTIMKIGNALSMRVTNHSPKGPSCVLWFDDATLGDPTSLVSKYPDQQILNVQCMDISKQRVERMHQSTFGYGMHVDAKSYVGRAVQKSDGNAVHDGRYIQCPLDNIQEGDVYQRVIDNSISEDEVVDYRVPVMNGKPVLVYRKFKRMEVRFTNEVTRSELSDLYDVFSGQELEQITAFTRAMGADFCELDILRDKQDGRIYIIDLNKTPYGPPAGLSKTETKRAVQLLSEAFQTAFLTHS